MTIRKFIYFILFSMLLASLTFGGISKFQSVEAAPANPTDETKVPHYFGPYPNWANSPFTLADAKVDIIGNGTGATATAAVGANGTITGITITSPGSGYTSATVSITGGGTGASADAVVSTTGSVTAINVVAGGTGYTAPTVSIGGGGTPHVASQVVAGATVIYNVHVGSATGGSFTLTVDSVTTGSIAWNALAADVQSALSLAGISASATGSGSSVDPWVITFAAAHTTVTMNSALLTMGAANASYVVLPSDSYKVTAGSATGGSFLLTVNGTPTATIMWNTLAADVQTALANVGFTSTVSGSGSIADPWLIVFATAPTSFAFDGAGLTQGVADASAAVGITSDIYNVTVGSATGGSFTLSVDGPTTGPIAWNALASDVQSALSLAGITATVTGSGSSSDPWVITFATAPTLVTPDFAGLTMGVSDAGSTMQASKFYSVTSGSATGGTFSLTIDGALVTGIAWNALASDVQTALSNAGITSAVSGSGSTIDPWVITFATAPLSFALDSSLLTQGVGDTLVTAMPTTIYKVDVGSAVGGTFVLTVDANTTGPIAWNALAADVQTALSNAGISAVVVGSGSIADPWVITFAAAPASVTINGALLTQPPFSGATATAYGGVEQVVLDWAGSGYIRPTVDFDMPNDPNGIQASGHIECVEVGCIPLNQGDPVTIQSIVVDQPGSGYSSAPNVVIRDGTIFDPVAGGGTGALAHATLFISSVTVDTFGSGYITAPTVDILDPNGTGASATAVIDVGAVTVINLINGGTGYITTGGIKKFQDGLPVLCDPTAGWSNCTDNNLGQHIPIAVPDVDTFPGTDYYVIAVVQHREQMNSSLPAQGTLLREYVQLETSVISSISKHVLLDNDLLGGGTSSISINGQPVYAVDDPHYLGPVIIASKDRAVRIVFYNLLPTGEAGDLFLPVDTTVMGSGITPGSMDGADQGTVMDAARNPMCTDKYYNPGMRSMCFTENRATLHLHGGISPWISDGTPHQWITPAGENTMWPEGVTVEAVPDMSGVAGVPDCSAPDDGCMTFYYTNQQSARLMFYHDHAWGITRLNVYAGEAAGYLITDPTEQALVNSGVIPTDQIPLIIQDRTFVPDAAQIDQQDPTWDYNRWGSTGDLWYHHVYMPAQNPGDPGGMSGYGRWMYGPWFWPPATPQHGPIANPYYDSNCSLDNPSTWQYQTDPFCEPQLIPGTPNITVGMEQFNDTPVVNGTAYPTLTVDPKSYRLRILNAANDRFWNLQWYIADPTTGTDSEVALNPAELAAAQLDPVVFPTALKSIMFNGAPYNLSGPDWIQIASEGGFLPAPVVIDGQQVTTWITDPTRFDVGNVDLHSLLLAPAERADVIVDFSQFAGKTLILYNDAPAAFPARVPSYDYYLGAPDMSPVGAPPILPGFGPNTRTIMQVKVAAKTPAPAFNLAALNAAFRHHADGSGVFESGQNPIIVGQAAYNSAYGTNFAASSWCNAPGSTVTRCDGFARISDQGGDLFGFNTLKAPNAKMQIPLQPKALHDEMNSVAFDEYGRMTANIGLEAVPATPALQNVILYPYVNPSTELIDATNLPKGDINLTPISSATDGTQIWKITHNGVDTHPIHFHLYDVQILNRVTWDNIIIPDDLNELGWKDTIRVSPLEDTIVALRPIIPTLPFELPNSIRMLNPMMAAGATVGFNNIDASGNPTNQIVNQLVNFGWEYVFHCHILSHEEMDMMRPVSVALPPNPPDGLSWSVTGSGNKTVLTLTWNDNSINETGFLVQRSDGVIWTDLGMVPSPLDQPNTHGTRSFADTTFRWNNTTYSYRVVAQNTIGYGGQFMSKTVQSLSAAIPVIPAPSSLSAALQAGPQVGLSWMDNTTNDIGFAVERSTDGVTFTQIATAPAHNNVGVTSYVDNTVTLNTTYTYRVAAVTPQGTSGYSNRATITVGVPADPSNLTVSAVRQGNNERVTLNWADNSNNEANFVIQRATDASFTTGLVTTTIAANTTTYTTGNIPRTSYYYRIQAVNVIGPSNWVNATPFPLAPAP